MAGGGGMAAPPSMSTSTTMMSTDADQGMVANHHLQVHLTRNDTGAVVQDVTPTIRITDKVTGISRDLSYTGLCNCLPVTVGRVGLDSPSSGAG
jgi:hypothetical protein